LKRVHFVCIGNTCRSPMAEAFANHYGSDVLVASSSGIAPVQSIVRNTVVAMSEMGVDVSGHRPRLYDPSEAAGCDIVVNMSGFGLPGPRPKDLVEWQVNDPMGSTLDTFRMVRGDLEQRVMRLILELRRRAKR
jgi:arsenate reductase (thioredoxin)